MGTSDTSETYGDTAPALCLTPSGGMVDAGDSKSLSERSPGSSPGRGISQSEQVFRAVL